MRLNLACGKNLFEGEGYINVDKYPHPGVTVVDLDVLPWPWETDSIDAIASNNGLEHLAPLGIGMAQRNIIAILREIHRILKPGGVAVICVPSTEWGGAFQDPTHVTYWNHKTFHYFIEESDLHADFAFEIEDCPTFTITGPDEMQLGVFKLDEGEEGVWVLARLRKPGGSTSSPPATEEPRSGSSARRSSLKRTNGRGSSS